MKATILSVAVLAICSTAALAQSTTTPAPATTPKVTGESIQDRKENQQDRIAQGVKSGQLTAGETSRLESKEASLNKEEHQMRKLDNGKLTASDKKTLTQQQNQLSKNIYRDKHNARKQ